MDLDFGINAGLVEELYAQYIDNPDSLDPSWRKFFEAREGKPRTFASLSSWGNGAHARANGDHGASTHANGNVAIAPPPSVPSFAPGRSPASIPPPMTASEESLLAQAAIQARVAQLLNAYRVRGHLFAHLDPLDSPPQAPPELDLKNFELRDDDLDKPFPTVDLPGVPKVLTLREIISVLSETYCRSIGVEYTQIEDPAERNWLRDQMESTRNRLRLDRETQLRILTKLSDAEIFEQFVHNNYKGAKRFSLEGGESLIPLCDLLIERAGLHGVSEVVFGMAHRGRLNVLVNLLDKSVRELFVAFRDPEENARQFFGSGDVKYHLGYSTDRVTAQGAKVHLTMTFNPSHLEFVNPVVEGRVLAKQDRLGGPDAKRRVMPLLIHGDAAFIGQGVVAETLNFSGIPGYATGGTVHVIVNNQVGFTTDPEEGRSTRYSTDIVRMLKVPVFHVNGEDPEAVATVAQLAIDYRQKFGRDVVIDMYCYRRYGHNENDEPRMTQPRMYSVIDQKPTVRQMYVKQLLELGQVTEAQADEIVARRRKALDAAREEASQKGFTPVIHSMGGVWSQFRGGRDEDTPEVHTAVPAEVLLELSAKSVEIPPGVTVHPKVLGALKARHDRLASGGAFAWDTGELLAYASLVAEKTVVRLSGQDAQRGTFTHRHAVVRDTNTGERYSPIAKLAQYPGRFEVYNSPLSENGVLGFDFGYSLDYPEALVIWEAQFGDFLNGAQVIVDQFITSSEDKWHRLSGLVLFLPHGFEGQGPEHSSARLERFLTAAAEDNIQVCNLTTPAQIFHCLRRQVLRPWRKPLVIMTPKQLLRAATTASTPQPVSTLKDLTEGRFQRVIPDTTVEPSKVKRVLLCSGKVYYDLALARQERKLDDVAIVRVEQLYPLNKELTEAVAPYSRDAKLVWVQEEPKNNGAWYYVNANMAPYLDGRALTCVARAASASPATGSLASHKIEQKELIDEAFA